MKRIIFSLVVVLAFALTSCGHAGYTDPAIYNDDIVAEQTKVYDALDALESLLSEDVIDETAVNAKLTAAVDICNASVKKLEEMGAYKKDDVFQQAGIVLFNGIKELLEKDYKDLIALYLKPIEEWTDEDFDKMYNIWDSIDGKIVNKEDAFLKAQDDFAKKNNITLY